MDEVTNEVVLSGEYRPQEVVEEWVYSWHNIGANQQMAAERLAYLLRRRRVAVAFFVLVPVTVYAYITAPFGFASIALTFLTVVLFMLSFAHPKMDHESVVNSPRQLQATIRAFVSSQAGRLHRFVGDRSVSVSDTGITWTLDWGHGVVLWEGIGTVFESETSFGYESPDSVGVIPKRWCASEAEVDAVRARLERGVGRPVVPIQTLETVDAVTPDLMRVMEDAATEAAPSRT